MYCVDNKDILLQGTMDYQFMEKKHSYVKYEVMRCSPYSRRIGDPLCATETEIDDWLENKKI